MLECLIIGDSIAVGTKMFAPKECVSYSVGGINSWQWNRRFHVDLQAKTVIISLGTNDHQYVKTEQELRRIRARTRANRVVWIMPPCNKAFCKPAVNHTVTKLAREYGDFTISTSYLQRDNIHPSWRGYQELVRKALQR